MAEKKTQMAKKKKFFSKKKKFFSEKLDQKQPAPLLVWVSYFTFIFYLFLVAKMDNI